MPNEDPRFTREELIALGLVKEEGTETAPATAPPAAPPAPTVDPAVAEALKTLAQLQARAPAPAQPAPPPPPKPTVDELIADGKVDEALLRAREEVREEFSTLTAQQGAVLSSMSKEFFRQKLGNDEFSTWYPLIQVELQRNGLSEAALATTEAWDQALAHTKAQNLNILMQREREKWLQENRSSIASGSRGGPSFGGGALPEGMTPDDMELARSLRINPVEYSRNKRILERYVDHRGDVDNAPVINRDIANRDEFGELKIKPGEF
jgi:hypothetical protein